MTTATKIWGRWTIAKTLISGLFFIALLGAALGGTGLFFIKEIEARLNNISDVTAPTVETADDLRANIWEATKVAEEISADEDLQEVTLLIEEFGVLAQQYGGSYAELDALVDDVDLLDELNTAKQLHKMFVENATNMFLAHQDMLNEESQADDLLDAFDGIGAQLIVMLDEFATENEAEMQNFEDEGDRLTASGQASADQVNDLLGDLFEQEYPVVEAALKLQRKVMEMQDTAGEYMAVEEPAGLETASTEFQALATAAQPYFDVLHTLAETQEDKEDAARLEITFDRWVFQANQEEQLFDTQRDMLEAEARTKDLIERLEVNADEVAAALDAVASQADALNDGADEEAAKVVHLATLAVGLGILIAALAAATLIFLVIKTVTGPIGKMTQAMGRLANDELETEVPSLDRRDEIGDMAHAVEVFKKNAIEVKKLNAEREAAKRAAEAEQRKAMLDIANTFEDTLGGAMQSLTSSSEGMQTTARDMKGIAEEMMASSSDVASTSKSASTNATTLASAMEEMVASSREIAVQMTRAQDTSAQTRDSAEGARRTVDTLNERVENIGEVVVAIQAIAEQTNMLALNATIEAARAGEMGKGFAVVADEVKKLAIETAEKTSDINTRIQEVQGATYEAVQAMATVIDNISVIDNAVTTVSAAVEEQNAASEEINQNVSRSAQAASDVTQVITGVQSQAETNGASSDTVLQSALELAQLSQSIQASVSDFLTRVRQDNRIDDPAMVRMAAE